MSAEPQYTFLEKAKETYNFHVRKKKEHKKWTLRDTAKILKRSLGSISEDLLIASWMKDPFYIKKLEKFSYAYEALEFIRKEEKKIGIEELK